MTLSRLVGGVAFIALGSWVIVLALTGEAKTAPGFQKAFGQWLSARASDLNAAVPAGVGWALMLAVALGVSYLAVRSMPLAGACDQRLVSHRVRAASAPNPLTTTEHEEGSEL